MSARVRSPQGRDEPVGRDREIDRLASYRHATSDGHGRIVLLGGEAGIGKSRVLRHFEASTAGRCALASSRCVEFVQTPLGPLHDLLQQLERRGVAPRDVATRSLIDRLAFERTQTAQIEALTTASLFDSIDSAFARYAARTTVVLSIEDVHWADRSTLAFLSYLADRLERRRILVVATYRTDEIGMHHPKLSQFANLLSNANVSKMELPPLPARVTQTLIERSCADPATLSAGVLADIARRSRGNPFFAEELLKNVLETGAARRDQLPLSIRASVLARAAALSQSEHEVLSMAAVLGERFSVERLIALVRGDRESVVRALERARSLQLLGDAIDAPGQLAFRHAMTQEVLYGELLAERVRPLHEIIALELEDRPNHSEASVELAHHWRRAGDLERAATYDEVAGDRAVEIGAFADAIFYYERALTHRKDDANLIHKIGASLGVLNHLSAGIERLRQAGDLYWRERDFEGFGRNASALGAQLYNSGDTAAATAVYRQALEALSAKLPQAALDLFRARIAYNCVAALDTQAALSFLSAVAEPIVDPMTASQTYLTRLKVAAMRGDIEQWRVDAERALGAARQIEDIGDSRLRHAHTQIALDALGLGEIDVARRHFAAAMPQDAESDSSASLVSAASALEHTLRGDFTTARSLLAHTNDAPVQSYAILVHVRSARLALGVCCDEREQLRSDDSESFLRYGVEHGMKLAIGLLGGPYAWALGIRGELGQAARWISLIADALPGPHRFLFAYLAGAQFGEDGDVLTMHRHLLEAAARPQDRVNKSVLALFEAFAARRGVIAADKRTCALAAAAGFEAIGWPWLAALSYEQGGESRRALEIFRRLGLVRDSRRLEVEGSDAGASVLSSRELEVAELVAKGHSNQEISQILHISTRTAEKHVSSSLKKLNLRSRLQLGRLLARSQNHSD